MENKNVDSTSDSTKDCGETKVSELPPKEVTGAQVPSDEELDEMTGGLNLVNKASCSTSQGSMNTVVSVGTV